MDAGISSVDLFFSILSYINYGFLTQFFCSIFYLFSLLLSEASVSNS